MFLQIVMSAKMTFPNSNGDRILFSSNYFFTKEYPAFLHEVNRNCRNKRHLFYFVKGYLQLPHRQTIQKYLFIETCISEDICEGVPMVSILNYFL